MTELEKIIERYLWILGVPAGDVLTLGQVEEVLGDYYACCRDADQEAMAYPEAWEGMTVADVIAAADDQAQHWEGVSFDGERWVRSS